MTARLYGRLLVRNFKANRTVWLPYMAAAVIIIALAEIVFSLASDPYVQSRSSVLVTLINMSGILTVFFAAMFLWYAGRFVNQSLAKEFNLYRVLGMERGHLLRLLALIHASFAGVALVLGATLGVLGGEFFYLLLNRLMRDAVQLEFLFSPQSIVKTIGVFLPIFLISWLAAAWSLQRTGLVPQSPPVRRYESLRAVVLALLSLVFIGIGYTVAIRTENPIQSFQYFLFAALAVMLGTWLFFMSVVEIVLRVLRRRKQLYYRPVPFVTISGLLPRMRHHAWGLANISILLTMLVITLATTSALYSSVQDTVAMRMPAPYQANMHMTLHGDTSEAARAQAQHNGPAHLATLAAQVERATATEGHTVQNLTTTYAASSFGDIQNGVLQQNVVEGFTADIPDYIIFLTAQEAGLTPVPHTLQAATFGENRTLPDKLALGDTAWQVNPLDPMAGEHIVKTFGAQMSGLLTGFVFIFPDADSRTDALLALHRAYPEALWRLDGQVHWALDSDLDAAANAAYVASLRDHLDGDLHPLIESRTNMLAEWYQINGGLLFIGLLLSLVFLVGVLLITFFKQLAEGQADRARFVTMQEVGMDDAMITRTLRLQIITMFFLPLLVALVHTAFAFPMVKKLLFIMGFTQSIRFVIASVIVVAVVALLYGCCYLFTTNLYRKLITR